MAAAIRLEIRLLQEMQAQNLAIMAGLDAEADASGVVYLDPSVMNPRSRNYPAIYGVYEHSRNGGHAFFTRTVSEAGTTIIQNAWKAGTIPGVIKRATLDAHRQAVARAHVDTGSMRAALRVRFARL